MKMILMKWRANDNDSDREMIMKNNETNDNEMMA